MEQSRRQPRVSFTQKKKIEKTFLIHFRFDMFMALLCDDCAVLITAVLVFPILIILYHVLSQKKKFDVIDHYDPDPPSDLYSDSNGERRPKGVYFTSDPTECVDIQFTNKGIGSESECPPMTVMEMATIALSKNPDSLYLSKEYKDSKGRYQWESMSRRETLNAIQTAARGFIALGLNPLESVCIMGFNAPQWFIADLAAIFAGGLAVGLYTTNNEGQCRYIINDCNARIVVLENDKLLQKFLAIGRDGGLGNVTTIIVWDRDFEVESVSNIPDSVQVISWNTLMSDFGVRDVAQHDLLIADRSKKIKAGHCCTLIYTSGTTGTPKGVMLSHDNLIWTICSVMVSQKGIAFWGPHSVSKHALISYLPLSHIAAQILDIYGPLCIGYNGGDGTVYFARNDALKGSLIKTLKAVEPTVFLGVPRVWEKIEEKMRRIGKEGNCVIKTISKKSKQIGLEAARNRQVAGSRNIPFGHSLCSMLIFQTIRKKLGFARLQLAITGAAPIKLSTMEYFHSLNIPLLEAYGMSESNGLITMGLEFHNKLGSVGPALRGVSVITDPQNDHEICFRGRNVMMGYLNQRDKTKEVFTENGYLRSGDIGRFDENNLLFITGRLKELIITAGGENIAPLPIEHCIKTLCSGLSHCVLIGENRKYLTLLVTLKTVEETSDVLDGDAVGVDSECKTIADAQKSRKWKEYIEDGIRRYNGDGTKCRSRAQRVQYFRILDTDFSEQTGEMTATLKLKRTVIRKKFKAEIDSMY